MKRIRVIALLGLALLIVFCASALAQTTGIDVDGKIYTFTGPEGTYEAYGKTFVIAADTVTIKENGKPDRVQALVASTDSSVVVDNVGATFVEQAASEAVATIAEDCAQSSYAVEESGSSADPAYFAPYAAFGLSYDAVNDALYYQGRRVRIFEDSQPIDEQSFSSLEHVDAQGALDVKARRDPAGTLTGLYALTDAEFAARDLRDWTQPQQSAATEGYEMTAAEKEALYAPYATFGLTYDAVTDSLTYQGKRVRNFWDVKQSNGESIKSGNFHGVITCICGDEGEVDVSTVRDYTKPDAEGNGTLTGLSAEDAL